MSNKLHTIQIRVPICPECGGGLKFYTVANQFRCLHCGNLYNIIGVGQTEREFICEHKKFTTVKN